MQPAFEDFDRSAARTFQSVAITVTIICCSCSIITSTAIIIIVLINFIVIKLMMVLEYVGCNATAGLAVADVNYLV